MWTVTEKSCLAVTLGIIIIFGLCGNLLVIIAILRFKRLRRSVNSYLILNLAICDFLTAFLNMPYHLATVLDVSIIADDGLLCKVGGILSYPFYISSTVTLVMLAVERHIAVSYPLRYLTHVTSRTISMMICYSWFQGVLFTIFFSFLGNIEFAQKKFRLRGDLERNTLMAELAGINHEYSCAVYFTAVNECSSYGHCQATNGANCF